MHHANDNQPLGADRVMEIRPSPQELNRILHRRFPGMGPAHGWQLDAAARKTFSADFSKWFGLDGRWHSTAEQYRQPRGKRRAVNQAGADSKPSRPVMLEHDQDVGAPWSRWSIVVAEGAEFLAGRTVPAVGGRQIRFDAAEDAMIALLDAKRAPPVAANDNEPIGRRRRSRRKYSRTLALAA
ncbi:hypothetical protein ABIC09_003424 [Bradyrhizobium sp. S3.12.5]|uniref:hypothetical protein n=1 Tax=Bradyrhizobium sp. S3.12.5 TaxID=3156386 RepID=UPI003391562D